MADATSRIFQRLAECKEEDGIAMVLLDNDEQYSGLIAELTAFSVTLDIGAVQTVIPLGRIVTVVD